jgi:type VI protein secretion system component Hcp
MAFMRVKGSSQGVFLEDGSRAGKERTLCAAVRFRGDVPHDVRHGKHAVTRHEPISVIHQWSPATVQFVAALWSNEVLDEVALQFLRGDPRGGEDSFAILTLTKATVAYADLRTGHKDWVDGEHRQLCDVGLHAEKLEFKMKHGSGWVTANYDRSSS